MTVDELRKELEGLPSYLEVKICRQDKKKQIIYCPLESVGAVGGMFGADTLLLREVIIRE